MATASINTREFALPAAPGKTGASTPRDRELELLRRRVAELEQQLETRDDEQARLRGVFDHMNLGVVVCGLGDEGDIVIHYINGGAERLEGCSRADVLGRSLIDAFPYLRGTDLPKLVREVFDDGLPRLHQTRLCDGSGDLNHCHNDSLVRLPNGDVAIVYYDSTERTRTEQKLRRFAKAIEQSIDGVALIDGSGSFVFVNGSFAAMHRYEVADIVGKRISDFHSREQMARVVEPFLDRVRREGNGIAEVMERRSDGTTFPMLLSATRLHDDECAFLGMVLIARDMTDAKKTTHQLRILQAAVEDASEGIIIATADNMEPDGPRILFVNQGFAQITGYDMEDCRGRTLALLHGPRTNQRAIQQARRRVASGQPFIGETVSYRKDGTEMLLEWHVSPVHDEAGRITHCVAIVHDITERREAQNAHLRSEQMMTIARTACTYNHEINNPLQAISGFAELLLRDETDDDRRDSLEKILLCAGRIHAVLERIESLSQPVFKQYVGKQQMLDLEEVEGEA